MATRSGCETIMGKAVAPVIATLLLVAIVVVGGSIIFVFSQGFFSNAEISLDNQTKIEPKFFEPTPRDNCERMAGIGNSYGCLQRNKIIENQLKIIELLEGQK